MSALEDIIKASIASDGAMDIAQFMTLALIHPQHGYYTKQDPLGALRETGGGDFITAPEISQMFGEVIGAWAAYTWMQMGSPARFILLECGPGRGTMMADMLRGARAAEGFVDACEIVLLEASPALRAVQERALKACGADVRWCDHLDALDDELPMIAIGNEFLDALSFRQLIYSGGAWNERVIIEAEGSLVFSARPAPMAIWPQFGKPREGDIYEFSTARDNVMRAIAHRLKAHGGAGLFIDYGHARSAFGDTFQAVKAHAYSDPLRDIGDSDLTSHVNFDAIADVARAGGVFVDGVIEQGAFLGAIGIYERARSLHELAISSQKPELAEQLQKDLHRLCDRDEMGALFKVIGVRYGFDEKLAGF